jgi:NifU-like protein involved in Fe-S cluster formation
MPYSATMMSHVTEPRNAGRMADADVVGRAGLNGGAPYTDLYLKIDGGVVRRATFTTFGCGAAIACGSAATELLVGRTREQCSAITGEEIIAALDGLPPEKRFCAGIVVAAIGDAVGKWKSIVPAS